MIDSVLKGTGNSRFLKSAVPAGTSWADALAMLQAGTFPIDFNGINTEGFQQVGTPLNKANLLKDATAAQIGLPPSTTPDGMFRALGNTGELHVWRKTVTTAQEIPAGYTLGDVKTKKDISATGSGQAYIGFYMGYSDSLAVDDNGGISLNPDNDYGEVTANSNFTYISSVIAGKFILIRSYQRPDYNSCSSLAGKIFYVPADASISMTQESNYLYIRLSKCQDVTGYPLTPAGTTTTYPVSTNPKAYQEGDDAKEAGYTLGDAVAMKLMYNGIGSGHYIAFDVSDSVSVTDSGGVSLAENTSVAELKPNNTAQFDTMKGKFFVKRGLYQCSTEIANDAIYFIPLDATVNVSSDSGGNIIACNKVQPVTGYAAIPAGTTIEYLGKLGDKARVQVVSYVGTGTYGENNPCSITADFKIKVAMMLMFSAAAYGITNLLATSSSVTIVITSIMGTEYKNYYGFTSDKYNYPAYGKISEDCKTFSWYGLDSRGDYYNTSGYTYYVLAIG